MRGLHHGDVTATPPWHYPRHLTQSRRLRTPLTLARGGGALPREDREGCEALGVDARRCCRRYARVHTLEWHLALHRRPLRDRATIQRRQLQRTSSGSAFSMLPRRRAQQRRSTSASKSPLAMAWSFSTCASKRRTGTGRVTRDGSSATMMRGSASSHERTFPRKNSRDGHVLGHVRSWYYQERCASC